MTWLNWALLIGILGGTVLVWRILNDPKHGFVGCCGCGQCAITGKCVLKKKKAVGKKKDPS